MGKIIKLFKTMRQYEKSETETQIKETEYQNIKSKTLCKQFFKKERQSEQQQKRRGAGGWTETSYSYYALVRTAQGGKKSVQMKGSNQDNRYYKEQRKQRDS